MRTGFSFLLQNMHHYIHQVASARPHESLVDPQDSAPVFQLTLRRTHMIEDTFRQLASADHCAFQRELLVNKPSQYFQWNKIPNSLYH